VIQDHAWIAARIPHAGSMCLLDGVVSWTQDAIHCRASSHHLADNPLRAAGRLGTANGIEYAAQAMAVHGALRAGADTAPRAGFLTSVREVVFHADSLDCAADLDIHAECLNGDGNHLMYAFRVEAGGAALVSGRASVMLDAQHNL
jgi:predicted hotdog family 3-hydroxylacyl-ACP dehydratase